MLFNRFSRCLQQGLAAVVMAAGLVGPGAALAQNPLAQVARVDDAVITRYEVDQRRLLLEVLQTAGDLEAEALERLIDERLQMAAARRAGIVPGPEDIDAGIAEFAQRVNLSGPEFVAVLTERGVAPEAFRDFVAAGVAWRQLVRQRFGPKVVITDAEVDRAISQQGRRGSARLLFSEIILPTNSPENTAISLELAPQIARLRSFEEFAAAARRFSASPTRDQGGRVSDWVPIDRLPPSIAGALLKMRPGEVTDPIQLPNAIAIFQLRAIAEVPAPEPRNPVVEYAAYRVAPARAATVRNRADTCDDLYGIARNEPPEVLERVRAPVAEIPRDIALELARLDEGEVSTALVRDGGATTLLVMLCSRLPDAGEEPSRDAVRQALSNARLTAFATSYLEELRAEAVIKLR